MRTLKFVIYTFVISSVIVSLSEWIITTGLRRSREDMFLKLNDIIEDSTYYDAVFFGSSRTWAHINPSIIDSISHSNVYNAGFDGAQIIDFAMLSRAYLNKHPYPKVMFFHFDEFSLNTSKEIVELPRYFPYLDHSDLLHYLTKYSPDAKVISKIPPLSIAYYSDLMKWVSIKYWLDIPISNVYTMEKGYRDNFSKWTGQLDSRLSALKKSAKTSPSIITKDALLLLDDIYENCLEKEVKVVFFSSPILTGKESIAYKEVEQYLTSYAKNKNISLYWFHQWSELLDTKYFYDTKHMNYYGAKAFSDTLSKHIIADRLLLQSHE